MRNLLVWFDTDSSILENKFCCGLKVLIKVAVYSVCVCSEYVVRTKSDTATHNIVLMYMLNFLSKIKKDDIEEEYRSE